jgi:hypothetical protein
LTLQPTMKRRLHERLHPLIGEEEADALLEEISPPDPVTREWLQDRFDQIDRRFEQVDRRFEQVDRRFDLIDQRFEQVDQRFEHIERTAVTKDWLQEHHDSRQELDPRLEAMEHRISTAMHRALVQQIVWVYGAAGLFALIISVVDRVWG